MRVLGIDPGSRHCGWGVIERDGTRLRGIAAGTIDPKESDPLEKRLRVIFEGLEEIIATHRPGVVAVEEIFYAKFAQSALRLGHARGVVLLAAARADLAITAYPPTVIKRSVAGRGAASKEQVAHLVSAILGLKTTFPVDATDALAVAITHALARPAVLPSRP